MLGKFTVNVEVVGTCNLRCPSCAVGNYGAARKAGSIGGTMDPERFGAIIDRLALDFAGREEDVFIALYSWGEPLLHPRIGDLIARARAAGFRVGLSSNLNFARYLGDAIQAGPDEFVVSLSGFEQAQYGISHSGGDIEAVKANMRRLADLIALNDHRTEVVVHYHCYWHNTQNDVLRMAELCEHLRFAFLPGIAYYMPVEKMLRAVDGELPPDDADIVGRMLVPLADQLTIAAANADPAAGCDLLDTRLDIDVDGAVKLCCSSYERANNVATDILAVPFEELQARRRRAALCGPCLGKGINRIYTVKDHGLWQGAANAALSAAASPLRYVPGGYAIEGLEDEASLLAGAVNNMNAGKLEAAAQFKQRLDALIASKYVPECTRTAGLLARVSRGGWRRGATIPRDPLLYHFVGGALLRNKDHDARGAQAIFGDLDALCDALEPDPGYRACIAAMRDVLRQWRALPC